MYVVDNFTYLGSTLSGQCTLMMRSLLELHFLSDYMEMSGIEAESGLTQSWKSTKLWYYQPSYVHVRPGQCTRLNHFHLSCLRKLLKIGWQDPGYRSHEESRDAKRLYAILKLAQLRWTGHITRMPDERLPKKIFYGELQSGKRSQRGQKKNKTKQKQNKKKQNKQTQRVSLKDFNIPLRILKTDYTGSSKMA